MMPDDGVQFDQPTLASDDIAAIDALVEAGFEIDSVEQSLRPRAERAAALLGLLDQTPTLNGDSALVDATYLRVARSASQPAEPALCADDDEALDAWVMEGYDASRVAGSRAERARQHQQIAAVVTETPIPAGGSSALIDDTLARIQSAIESQESNLQIETHRGAPSLRWADLISVAAVLLIGASVIWPVVGQIRHRGQLASCVAGLGNVAMAFDSYASGHKDALPVATAGLGGGTWWNVGKPSHSNAANLYTLIDHDYTSIDQLACPGNPNAPTVELDDQAHDWRSLEEVSYSYRILFGAVRPNLHSGARFVIIADASPVVRAAIAGKAFDPYGNSLNHRQKGQHVLWSDGAAQWAKTPQLEPGDNLWLPRALEIAYEQKTGRLNLAGHETPKTTEDDFVGP